MLACHELPVGNLRDNCCDANLAACLANCYDSCRIFVLLPFIKFCYASRCESPMSACNTAYGNCLAGAPNPN
jgi:hypothetical protein